MGYLLFFHCFFYQSSIFLGKLGRLYFRHTVFLYLSPPAEEGYADYPHGNKCRNQRNNTVKQPLPPSLQGNAENTEGSHNIRYPKKRMICESLGKSQRNHTKSGSRHTAGGTGKSRQREKNTAVAKGELIKRKSARQRSDNSGNSNKYYRPFSAIHSLL